MTDYLLGDSDRERSRLETQAALWDPVSHALFDRAGVQPGWRVLEIGPGAGSLNVELRRRARRPVDIVDQSPTFVALLQARWREDGFGAGRIWNEALLDAELPAAEYDFIFARWVFLFLPEPQRHLAKLARALKPGGTIAIQDYYARNTFCLVPTPPEWPALVAADLEYFRRSGSDPDVAAQLPPMFAACGLDLVHVEPQIKTGHPGSLVWKWLSDYYLEVLDTYATLGPLTPGAAAGIREALVEAARRPASLLVGPAVLDLVGRRSGDLSHR